MSRRSSEVAILLADITGSTPLYESVGDAAALRRIGECLDGLRSIADQEGGTFVRSKGDDVLYAFADPSAALRAIRAMLRQRIAGPLAIHAGVHFGHIIYARGDIFGDAVNMTARLATLAKPGEVLISKSFVDRLPATDIPALRVLDKIPLKGKSAPTRVYSLQEDDAEPRTEAAFGDGRGHTHTRTQAAAADLTVMLVYAGNSLLCKESTSVSLGRSTNCDLVIRHPWVSRQHATVTVQRGKVQLDDRSSAGTYIVSSDGHEFFIRRETVVLTGSGTISPAVRTTDAGAKLIRYEVVHEQRSQDG